MLEQSLHTHLFFDPVFVTGAWPVMGHNAPLLCLADEASPRMRSGGISRLAAALRKA